MLKSLLHTRFLSEVTLSSAQTIPCRVGKVLALDSSRTIPVGRIPMDWFLP